jgi:hypothetical protein
MLTALVSDGIAIDSISWSVTVSDKSSPVSSDTVAHAAPQIIAGSSSEDEIDNLIGGDDESSSMLHDVLIKVMHMLHDSSGGLGGSNMPQIIDPSLLLRIMPQSGSPPALNDSIIKPLIDSLNKK